MATWELPIPGLTPPSSCCSAAGAACCLWLRSPWRLLSACDGCGNSQPAAPLRLQLPQLPLIISCLTLRSWRGRVAGRTDRDTWRRGCPCYVSGLRRHGAMHGLFGEADLCDANVLVGGL